MLIQKIGNYRQSGKLKIIQIMIVLSYLALTLGQSYNSNHTILMSITSSLPQIFLILMSIVLLFFGRVVFTKKQLLGLLIAFFFVIIEPFSVSFNDSYTPTYIPGLAFSAFLAVGAIVSALTNKYTQLAERKNIFFLISLLLIFFVTESITRWTLSPSIMSRWRSPEIDMTSMEMVTEASAFYQYKFGLFFGDSNSTGLALLCLIALMFGFRRYIKLWQYVLVYILMFATLSRASIIASLFQLLLFAGWRWRRSILIAICSVAPIVVLWLVIAYAKNGSDQFVSIDSSFASKLMILNMMTDLYQKFNVWAILFGIGAGNTAGFLGIAAHTIISTFALEFGVIGSLIIVLYIWLLQNKSQIVFYLLILPIIINGFSLVLPNMPFFFVTLGFMGALREKLSLGKSAEGLNS
jgi:hypothetical protein